MALIPEFFPDIALANKRDVPYQSLLKVFLADRVASEMTRIVGSPDKAPLPTSRARRKAAARKSSPPARG